MNREKHFSSGSAVGSSSLLVILGVVCFAMLALLSLNTALAQQRLTQGSLAAEQAYRAADLEAEILFARLRSGETVPEVIREGDQYRYECSISQFQTLQVELKKTETGWQVLRWQAVAHPEITEENLPVWEGG